MVDASRGAHARGYRSETELRAALPAWLHTYNHHRHAGVGYVTPDDEHTGRGDGIRQARRDGLTAARDARINYRRTTTEDNR